LFVLPILVFDVRRFTAPPGGRVSGAAVAVRVLDVVLKRVSVRAEAQDRRGVVLRGRTPQTNQIPQFVGRSRRRIVGNSARVQRAVST